MSGKWADSNRRASLPRNWPEIREQVKRRDGYRCTATLRDDTRCPDPGTDVDHIGDPHVHELKNLRLLCSWHHNKKSSAQGNSARNKPPPLRRPAEKHPGMR
ncbi:HNH endonuclease [Nonomuraea terrae]|uniref:HNH endonuclease n=1 Tax=Nonomuraea terrae TaxID=2530383 RepID=A0A4V2YNJ5_9ACTN|nr:HNH endonuclease [Nonomuraea terrae]TDD54577.1 HNH endonuclease [Nonomuraea terrae]